MTLEQVFAQKISPEFDKILKRYTFPLFASSPGTMIRLPTNIVNGPYFPATEDCLYFPVTKRQCSEFQTSKEGNQSKATPGSRESRMGTPPSVVTSYSYISNHSCDQAIIDGMAKANFV